MLGSRAEDLGSRAEGVGLKVDDSQVGFRVYGLRECLWVVMSGVMCTLTLAIGTLIRLITQSVTTYDASRWYRLIVSLKP